ncbi:hypothetical protein IV02_04680 [Pseudomonas syringae]|uniref:Uncharacterized protein n=1 Tax=Pseudomonas syringae TaxID=317 RepID=A0A085VF33_PSESX|nr:hypothetical protein IV02_04680 [Pseudomonas syringae]
MKESLLQTLILSCLLQARYGAIAVLAHRQVVILVAGQVAHVIQAVAAGEIAVVVAVVVIKKSRLIAGFLFSIIYC